MSVSTHALHYGTACFEGMRGNWNQDVQNLFVFRMQAHYERFLRSSSILQMKLPYTAEQLCDITLDLLRVNDFKQDVYIRPIAFKSAEKVANLNLQEIEDGLSIIVLPFGDYIEGGSAIKCMTSSWRRPEDTMLPTGVKIAGLYTTSILAKTEAKSAGFEEAILLNNDGTVSEGSGENIFLVINGGLHTPSETDNCLLGVTRDSVIQLATHELGLEVTERRIHRSEIYLADEAFLTGTAAHVTPIGSLDGRTIGTGAPGRICMQLQDIYFSAITGRNEKYRHWCTRAYA